MTEAFPEPGVPRAEFTFAVDRGESRVVGVTSASEVVGLVVLVLTGPQGLSLKFTLRVSLGKPDDPDAGVWPAPKGMPGVLDRREDLEAEVAPVTGAPAVRPLASARQCRASGLLTG
jgi:hypothetical protein